MVSLEKSDPVGEKSALKKVAGKIDFLSGIGYNEIGNLDLRGEKDTMKTKKQKKNRFKIVLNEPTGESSGCKVIEDTETGINYLYHFDQFGGGLTVLIDEEGEPVVAPEK